MCKHLKIILCPQINLRRLIDFASVFPLPPLYLTITPIQSIYCLIGLLIRNTLSITEVPSKHYVIFFYLGGGGVSKQLWLEINDWIVEMGMRAYDLSNVKIIVGDLENARAINSIILMTKRSFIQPWGRNKDHIF